MILKSVPRKLFIYTVLILFLSWFFLMPENWLKYLLLPVLIIVLQIVQYIKRRNLKKSVILRLGKKYFRFDFWIFAVLILLIFNNLFHNYLKRGFLKEDITIITVMLQFLFQYIIFREQYYISFYTNSFTRHYPISVNFPFEAITKLSENENSIVIAYGKIRQTIYLSKLNPDESLLFKQYLAKGLQEYINPEAQEPII